MKLLLLAFWSLNAFSDLPPSLGENNYRCLFLSPSNVRVVHSFKIQKDFRRLCEYGISVDGVILTNSKAFNEDCRWFMRAQINKGSACMTDEF